MKPVKVLLSVAVLGLAGFGIYTLTGDKEVADNPELRQDAQADEKPAEKKPESNLRTAGATWLADPKRVPPEERLQMPDGTWVMALNGVKGARAPDWPAGVEFSPIKRIITDKEGQQWYELEDGSQLSTLMRYRADLGRMDPVTVLANPTQAAPLLNEDGPTRPDPNMRR
jgi:hypothetical protein